MPDPDPDAFDDQPMADGALLALGVVIVIALLLCVLMFLIAQQS